MNSEKTELTRIKYLYRRLILQGKIKVAHESARQLIGPDCAYHLYATFEVGEDDTGKKKGGNKKGQ